MLLLKHVQERLNFHPIRGTLTINVQHAVDVVKLVLEDARLKTT